MIRRIRTGVLHPRGADEQTLVEDLGRCLAAGDASGIRSLVADDVVLVIDSGGAEPGAPLDGAGPTSSALAVLVAPGGSVTAASINGSPGLVVAHDDVVTAIITVEVRAGLLSTVWVVSSIPKLRHWNA